MSARSLAQNLKHDNMTTLRNSFYGTSVQIRSSLTWDEIDELSSQAKQELPRYRTRHDKRMIRFANRLKTTLCGSLACKCGTVR